MSCSSWTGMARFRTRLEVLTAGDAVVSVSVSATVVVGVVVRPSVEGPSGDGASAVACVVMEVVGVDVVVVLGMSCSSWGNNSGSMCKGGVAV
jgi:hypothetical protein